MTEARNSEIERVRNVMARPMGNVLAVVSRLRLSVIFGSREAAIAAIMEEFEPSELMDPITRERWRKFLASNEEAGRNVKREGEASRREADEITRLRSEVARLTAERLTNSAISASDPGRFHAETKALVKLIMREITWTQIQEMDNGEISLGSAAILVIESLRAEVERLAGLVEAEAATIRKNGMVHAEAGE